MSKTKVIIEDSKWFMIVKVDDKEQPLVGVRHVQKMGYTKAKAILDHIEDLKKYVEAMEK